MKFLLDTNVLSEPLRASPDPRVVTRMREHAADLATATIVWHELVFGTAALPPGKRRRAYEHYLDQVVARNIPILAYDVAAATWHAHERARLASAGVSLPFVDGQIAAIAAVNGLTLVTANARDFAKCRDLRLADWSA